MLRRERNTRHRKRITVRKVGKPYLIYVFLFGMRWEIVSFSPITESMLHKNSLYRYNTLLWNQKKIFESCAIVDIFWNRGFLFHPLHYAICHWCKECLNCDFENNIWNREMHEIDLSHSTEECYRAKYNRISSLTYQCRTNRTHCEPSLSCHPTNPKETPRIGKWTSEVSKDTSQSNSRDETKNCFIAWLVCPKTRCR